MRSSEGLIDAVRPMASVSDCWKGRNPGSSTMAVTLPGGSAIVTGVCPRAPRSLRSTYTVAPGGSLSTCKSASDGRNRLSASWRSRRSPSGMSSFQISLYQRYASLNLESCSKQRAMLKMTLRLRTRRLLARNSPSASSTCPFR